MYRARIEGLTIVREEEEAREQILQLAFEEGGPTLYGLDAITVSLREEGSTAPPEEGGFNGVVLYGAETSGKVVTIWHMAWTKFPLKVGDRVEAEVEVVRRGPFH